MKQLPTLLAAIAAMVFVLACSKETEAPPRNFESVHPSLERQSKLNMNYGLYEVIPGSYQRSLPRSKRSAKANPLQNARRSSITTGCFRV
jgi:hypothetical protein